MDAFQRYLLVLREEGTLIKDGILGIPPVLVLLLQLLTQLIVVFFQVNHAIFMDTLKGEGHSGHDCVLTSLLVKSDISFYFELKLQVFFMTKVVSNRDICFIKAV